MALYKKLTIKNKMSYHTTSLRYNSYLGALALMLIAMPLSNYLMSVSQFLLAGIWLWDCSSTGFSEKFTKFFKNKVALVVTSLFLLHLIGLIYTTDFNYGLKDIRTKLPLLIIPFILSTLPQIKKREFYFLIIIFIASVFIGTCWSTMILYTQPITDAREITPFLSHIRFSMNICLAIFFLFFFIYQKNYFTVFYKILFGILLLWFILFLFILESLTGIIILLTVSILLSVYFIFKLKNIYFKSGILITTLAVILLVIFYVKETINSYLNIVPVSIEHLDKYTALGNPYTHDTINFGKENGKYVGLYLSESELRNAWNKRSNHDYNGKDSKNQSIKYTLIRFLNSKGYRKDASGVNSLTDEEVHYIESGVANVEYLSKIGFKTRIYQAIMGYQSYKAGGNPSGNSLFQRVEYWKASIYLIKHNFLIGVGTGDMNIAFSQAYEKLQSPLDPQFRRRSHNQYLSIFVDFGIIGFVWFIFSLFYPPIKLRKFHSFFYIIFFLTLILSMFVEDTIESQAGLTFFAFFNSFFLFCHKNE